MKMVEYLNNQLLTSTKIIAKYTKVKHQNILQLFRRHENNIKRFGVIMFRTCKPEKGSKGGRPETFYFLNEEQFTFFIMLMANSVEVVEFKIKINKQFHKMRKALLEIKLRQQNKEWLEAREKGKQSRKLVVKEYENYLKYSVANGSKTYEKNPSLVYSKFSDMVNKALFEFEFKPPKGKTRDYMNQSQLNIVNSAELLAQRIIQKELDKGTEYHEIYQITKKKMIEYAEIAGKSKVIDILISNQINMINLLED